MPPVKQARTRAPQPEALPEVVEPAWMLKAIGAVMALGLLCAYITLCAFFSWGQWQFVLNPSRTVSTTPASQQLAFEAVRFGDGVSGQPQLSGWWIPSDLPSDPAVVILHGGSGTMADALPVAKAAHAARLQVLLFDYSGYGQSGGEHPSQATMQHNAEQALTYLSGTRHVPANHILALGIGLGASLATRLCTEHPDLPGLVLINADGDTASRVEADPRSRIIPVRWLFHEKFPLADPLHRLKTPKLLVSQEHGNAPEFAQRAASPKITAEIPGPLESAKLTAVIRRFLDAYIPHPVGVLEPGK